MKRYHFSTKTGEVERCRAFLRVCKYSLFSEHLSSSEEVEMRIAKSLEHPILKIINNAEKIEISSSDLAEYKTLFPYSDFAEYFDVHGLSARDGRKYLWKKRYNSMNNLTKIAIDIYYNEVQSAKINKYLMGDNTAFDKEPNPEYFIEAIDEIEAYIYNYEQSTQAGYQNLFKGISFENNHSIDMLEFSLSRLAPGSRFQFAGFTSTSASFEEALNFSRGDHEDRYLYEINTKKGGFINDACEEQLLNMNSEFVFIETIRVLDNIVIIRLAEER